MPYGQGYAGGLGMGYNPGVNIPMMGVHPDMTAQSAEVQRLSQANQTQQIQAQQASNQNAVYQQLIESGQMKLDDDKAARQTQNDFSNMVSSAFTSTRDDAPQGQGQVQSSNLSDPNNPATFRNPQGQPASTAPSNPMKTASDNAISKNPVDGTPLNTHPDTNKAIDPNNPSFAASHTWDSKDPQTGAVVHNTFDRQGLFDKMMSYTDANGAHPLAAKANDAMLGWTASDAADEKAKQDTIVARNAQLLGQVAAFSYLRPQQQADAYARFKNEVESQQPGATQSWPADITSREGQAWLANEQRQAEANVSTASNASKMAEDALKKAQTAVQPSVSFKNTAEGIKALAEAAKVKAEAGGAAAVPPGFPTSQLTGDEYRKLLNPAQLNWVTGLASGNVKLSTNRKEAQAQIAVANQAFPDANIEGAQKFSKDMASEQPGTNGGVRTGAMKTFGHLGSMIEADGEGTQIGGLPIWAVPLNKAGNSMSVSGGNARNAWNTEHTALVNEVEKQFKGTGAAAAEAFRDMKNMSFDDAPARKMKVYQAYANLMTGLTDAVESQRRQILGDDLDPGTSLLDSRSQEIIKKLNGGRLPSGTLPAFDAGGRVGTKIPRSQQGNNPPGGGNSIPQIPQGHTIESVTSDAKAAVNAGAPKASVINDAKRLYGVDLTGKL